MLSKGTQVPKAWVSCTQVPSPLQLPPTLHNLPPTVEGVTSWDGCPSQDPVHTRVPRDPRCKFLENFLSGFSGRGTGR